MHSKFVCCVLAFGEIFKVAFIIYVCRNLLVFALSCVCTLGYSIDIWKYVNLQMQCFLIIIIKFLDD